MCSSTLPICHGCSRVHSPNNQTSFYLRTLRAAARQANEGVPWPSKRAFSLCTRVCPVHMKLPHDTSLSCFCSFQSQPQFFFISCCTEPDIRTENVCTASRASLLGCPGPSTLCHVALGGSVQCTRDVVAKEKKMMQCGAEALSRAGFHGRGGVWA